MYSILEQRADAVKNSDLQEVQLGNEKYVVFTRSWTRRCQKDIWLDKTRALQIISTADFYFEILCTQNQLAVPTADGTELSTHPVEVIIS